MSFDELIEANRFKVDICTTYIDIKRRYIFESGLRSVRWSVLIDHPKFASVKKRADAIYCCMRDLGYLCPHIQNYPEYFQMKWVEANKIITIRVYLQVTEFAITCTIGTESKTIHCFETIDNFIFALGALVDDLASDDNGSSSVKRPLRSKIRSTIRDIPRFRRDGDGEQSSVSSDRS